MRLVLTLYPTDRQFVPTGSYLLAQYNRQDSCHFVDLSNRKLPTRTLLIISVVSGIHLIYQTFMCCFSSGTLKFVEPYAKNFDDLFPNQPRIDLLVC